MATDRFFIAPYDQKSGLQTNVKPWLIPDEAFSNLTNAYVFRGRVRKRFGSRWFQDNVLLSRFRVLVGETSSAGSLTGTVPASGTTSVTVGAPGQWFLVGDVLFTVNTTGALLISNGSATTATFNQSTGEFVFTAVYDNTIPTPVLQALENVYWYPGFPAMGLLKYETSVSDNEITVGFDTSYSYIYNNGWNRLAMGAATWTGTDSEFFWGTTYTTADASTTAFFVTNFNPPDGIRYYLSSTEVWNQAVFNYGVTDLMVTTDGSGAYSATLAGGFIGQSFIIGTTIFTIIAATGALGVQSLTTAAPMGTGTYNTTTGALTFTGAKISTEIYYTGNNYVNTAAIIVIFKNRMLLFNTIENGVPYPNRCRYSQIGSVLDPSAWFTQIPGKGGAVDATTVEAVNTVEFVKDRLIVSMTNSTWEIVYNGNQVYPFVWQQINTELGSEASFSVVPFDKVALYFGGLGIHACNGSNVERIDQNIPEEAFNVSNANAGIYRIYGIRDYFLEMVYWSFPSTDTSSLSYFPNSILVYNYKNGTWAINYDTITCFGYFNPQTGVTWNDDDAGWDDPIPWDNGEDQILFKQVIGGNQQGFTMICDPEITSNIPVLQITNITTTPVTQLTIINHTLTDEEYIFIQGCTYSDLSNGLNGLIYQVIQVVDVNTIDIGPVAPFTGTYTGGGLAARVSKIDIQTKEYNFYAGEGRNAYISKVDFMVDSTATGQVLVNFFDSTADIPLLQDGIEQGVVLGTGNLDTAPYPNVLREATQVRLWHPVYLFAEGEVVQLQITMNFDQMTSPAIRIDDFQLHAMCIYATPTSARFQ